MKQSKEETQKLQRKAEERKIERCRILAKISEFCSGRTTNRQQACVLLLFHMCQESFPEETWEVTLDRILSGDDRKILIKSFALSFGRVSVEEVFDDSFFPEKMITYAPSHFINDPDLDKPYIFVPKSPRYNR